MKVYPDKLADSLRQNIARAYLVSGDEPLLVQECCDLVRGELRAKGFTERELFHVEGAFDWEQVLYSGNSLSLFADKKLIEIRLPTGKPGDQGGKALPALLDRLTQDLVLLLVLPRLDASTRRTRWFKALEAQAVFVQVWPVDAKDLPRWLEARFRRAGLRITREAVRVMAQRIEGNLLAAVQEIERLKLIVGDRQIDVADVADGVADSARYDVFRLIDAALQGNAGRCVRMVRGLKAEGVEPLFLVSLLSREVRSMESMKTAIAGGGDSRQVLKQARVWDRRVPLVSGCLERHSAQAFREMQLLLGMIDRKVKGLEPGEPWRELQRVVLMLAGVRLHAPLRRKGNMRAWD